MKDHCEMCGRSKTLRIAKNPSNQTMTLCKLCADGSAEVLAERSATLNAADATCQAIFGMATVRETTHSIMQDAKEMTSVSPAVAPIDNLDERQEAMVLHALRVVQELRSGQKDGCLSAERSAASHCSANGKHNPVECFHFDGVEPLTVDEIDTLCERLNYGVEDKSPVIDLSHRYDYTNQAWVVAGRYVACGHLPTTPCECYGRIHEGESPAPDADVH